MGILFVKQVVVFLPTHNVSWDTTLWYGNSFNFSFYFSVWLAGL